MADLQFLARALKPFAEPVTQEQLVEGSVYFSIVYFDNDGLVPIFNTWVYAGKNLDPTDRDTRFYFQDALSHQRGLRYGSDEGQATFQIQLGQNLNHIFDYENALNELLKCSLRRSDRK